MLTPPAAESPKMSEDPEPGMPVGVEIFSVGEQNVVVLRMKLSSPPKEGEAVSLAMPVDSALALALGIISCVKDLQQTNVLLNEIFPPVDPSKGN